MATQFHPDSPALNPCNKASAAPTSVTTSVKPGNVPLRPSIVGLFCSWDCKPPSQPLLPRLVSFGIESTSIAVTLAQITNLPIPPKADPPFQTRSTSVEAPRRLLVGRPPVPRRAARIRDTLVSRHTPNRDRVHQAIKPGNCANVYLLGRIGVASLTCFAIEAVPAPTRPAAIERASPTRGSTWPRRPKTVLGLLQRAAPRRSPLASRCSTRSCLRYPRSTRLPS